MNSSRLDVPCFSLSASKIFINFYPKHTMSDLETELRISIDKAMQCRRRDPPKEPVIALSPKRFAQFVALLRHEEDVPVCDTSRHYPPFRLEDPLSWPFCVFGTCQNNKCECFGNFTGPSCAVDTSVCWLLYCFLNSCHSSLQSFNCKCDPTLHATDIKVEYWFDEGKRLSFMPPPPNWKASAGLRTVPKPAGPPIMKEIWVPLFKPKPGGGRQSSSSRRQQLHPQHGQFQGGRNHQQLDPNSGQVRIVAAGQSVNPFQSPQFDPNSGQIQGNVDHSQFGNHFQSQQRIPEGGQNYESGFSIMAQDNEQGVSRVQRPPDSIVKSARKNSKAGSQGSRNHKPEDSTDDIEEALKEMTEEPSSSPSLFRKKYILCLAVIILNYGYHYILNV